MPYQSFVKAAAGALPLHVQRLIGDMRHFQLPTHLDYTIEVDIIIATDGSVMSWVGYHSLHYTVYLIRFNKLILRSKI
jgi:hypothetical protein